jgi:hypothetical protein
MHASSVPILQSGAVWVKRCGFSSNSEIGSNTVLFGVQPSRFRSHLFLCSLANSLHCASLWIATPLVLVCDRVGKSNFRFRLLFRQQPYSSAGLESGRIG